MSLAPDGGRLTFQNPQNLSECWISATTTPEMAWLNTNYASYFETYVVAACAYVNRYCNRYFNLQTADQIWLRENLIVSEYVTFVLDNRPLDEVTNVWLQIVDTFNAVSLEYLQVDTSAGVVRILPDIFTLVAATVPDERRLNGTNVWIRYSSGFTINEDTNDVPLDVQLATAMYAKYLFDIGGLNSTLSSFSTQTYSQTNRSVTGGDTKNQNRAARKAGGDPRLFAINSLLDRYVISNYSLGV